MAIKQSMTISIAVLLCVSQLVLPAARQEHPEDSIRRLGGRVVRDEKLAGKPIIAAAVRVTDAQIKVLRGLDRLASLNLTDSKLTDLGLREVASLKSLQDLDLSGTFVTDAGLKELKALHDLRSLGLSMTFVTGTGLKELSGLERLTELD